ncbi:MAG: carboxypeptidase-like regulatory domain-containing protein, partial [Bacteroidota bacterium]
QRSYPLRGTVELEGEPAIGARIVLVGTELGTYTDQDGSFTIKSPHARGKLAISLLGALSQVVDFSPQNRRFTIKLIPQAISLEEIEILGYGNRDNICTPVCGPRRPHCVHSITSLRNDISYMSDPAILNGPSLSIARQGNGVRPQFAQAAVGTQANLSFNGMPLDQKSANLFLFLWETTPQQISSQNPLQALASQGAQALGGNLSFFNRYLNPNDPDVRYQGLGGLSFQSGETQFTHQEHHLRLQRAKTDQKLQLRGGLDYVRRPDFQSDAPWELMAAQLQGHLNLKKLHWQGNLMAGNMQFDTQKANPTTSQIYLLSQQIRTTTDKPLRLTVNQVSQISSQADSNRQYHALRAMAAYQHPQWKKLRLQSQYDFQRSAEQQVQAFTAGAQYELPQEITLGLSTRQERSQSRMDNSPPNASLIHASLAT